MFESMKDHEKQEANKEPMNQSLGPPDLQGLMTQSHKPTSQAIQLELKQFPHTLRYKFLDRESIKLVIVNASLREFETVKLLIVLKKHHKAIGYTINDLKAISSCLHAQDHVGG